MLGDSEKGSTYKSEGVRGKYSTIDYLLLLLKTATETKPWSECAPGENTRVRLFSLSFHRPISLSVRLIDAFDGVKSIHGIPSYC